MFDLSDLDAFICPHRLPFDLSDQVGAFGFICLCGPVAHWSLCIDLSMTLWVRSGLITFLVVHVGRLEFMFYLSM